MAALAQACLARQAIFTADLRVTGYELLYRAAPGATGAGLADATRAEETAASAATLTAALTDIGLDAIVGRSPAWVNVGSGFLLDDLTSVLPPERTVIELLETVSVCDEVVGAVASLRRDGYRVALDDFVLRPLVEPLLDLADVVKIDVAALGWDEVEAHVELLRARPAVLLLAEKVETHAMLARCLRAGFVLVQGNFLCEPRLLTDERVSAAAAVRVQLAAQLHDPELGFDELTRLIGSDVTLGYRLLRYVNSAYVGLRKPIASMREALLLVGLRRIRSWATLLLLVDAGGGREELVSTALLRAHMCGLLAPLLALDADEAFLAGLLSVVDALVDRPLELVLGQLPIGEGIRAALLAREGPLGRVLAGVVAWAGGDFDAAAATEFDAAALAEAYLDALRASERLARGLAPAGDGV